MRAVRNPFLPAGRVRLAPGRDAAVRRGHPWVYRGSLASPLPAAPGPVEVCAADGDPLGVALSGSSGGSLALRMVALGDEGWSGATLRRRLDEAVELRDRLAVDGDAWRLVHAEGDRLPGLVVDRYAGWAVIETFEEAWRPYLPLVVEALGHRFGGAVLRDGRRRGSAAEVLAGGPLPPRVVIREGAARFAVDLAGGQKTGFFLDQRENRKRLAELSRGAEVCNLFSYSGGFAVSALAGGARRAVNVDASAAALDLARESYAANGFAVEDGDFVAGDAFEVTREMVAAGRRFDVVVVDPPAFVRRRGDLSRGLAGYRDINLQALRLAAPGGLVVTCSCSALVDEERFGGALLAAAIDAGRDVRVLERRSAGPDHPVALACPETRHLKAWFCLVR